MRIAVGTFEFTIRSLELVGSMLAVGMVAAVIQAGRVDLGKVPGLVAIMLAIAAATLFIRAGQRKVAREVSLAVRISGLDERVTQLARARGIR